MDQVRVNWRLFVPESWDDEKVTDQQLAAGIRRRRARCQVPDAVRHREKWRLALDLHDETLGRDTGQNTANRRVGGVG
jgi:hypothetical protein